MPASDTCNFSQAVEAFYDLNVGVIGQGIERHERPHKPLMLLIVLDLIAAGKATPDFIPWSQELRSRFSSYFEQVKKRDDQCTPENPFFYLRNEKWWQPFRRTAQGEHPLDGTPTVGDADSALVFARIMAPIASWIVMPQERMKLREAIIARYFPHARDQLSAFFLEASILKEQETITYGAQSDTNSAPGRSSGFRRKILEIYDCQCAACGLRIKLPQVDDLTFVDAAHLIPFNQSANDHPTNGIALCKNHHWAMDRFLIAPSPTGIWKVSSILDRRRSEGERNLLDLHGAPILQPNEEAFLPASDSLRWRMERLVV